MAVDKHAAKYRGVRSAFEQLRYAALAWAREEIRLPSSKIFLN